MIPLILFLLAGAAEAKRYVPPPAPGDPQLLSQVNQQFLAERVGKELRKCAPLKHGASATVSVTDSTSKKLDTWIIAEQLEKELKGDSSRPVEVQVTISLREWKGGRNLATYTLKAVALEAGRKICEKLHRTVVLRDAGKK